MEGDIVSIQYLNHVHTAARQAAPVVPTHQLARYEPIDGELTFQINGATPLPVYMCDEIILR